MNIKLQKNIHFNRLYCYWPSIFARIFKKTKVKANYCPYRGTLTNIVLLTISFSLLTKMMMDPDFENLDAFNAAYLNLITFTTIGKKQACSREEGKDAFPCP